MIIKVVDMHWTHATVIETVSHAFPRCIVAENESGGNLVPPRVWISLVVINSTLTLLPARPRPVPPHPSDEARYKQIHMQCIQSDPFRFGKIRVYTSRLKWAIVWKMCVYTSRLKSAIVRIVTRYSWNPKQLVFNEFPFASFVSKRSVRKSIVTNAIYVLRKFPSLFNRHHATRFEQCRGGASGYPYPGRVIIMEASNTGLYNSIYI